MSDQRDQRIRRKAIGAIKAVTAGAILFAGVACSGEEPDGPHWNIGNHDAGGDVTQTDTADTAQADSGSTGVCSTEEVNEECYAECNENNDIACCQQWGTWLGDECAAWIEGPFVPPRMLS